MTNYGNGCSTIQPSSQPSAKPIKPSRPTRPSADEYQVVELEGAYAHRSSARGRALAWIEPMWVGSLRNEGGWAMAGGKGDYEKNQVRLIDEILNTTATSTLMLVHKTDPEVFFGFICGAPRLDDGTLIHYVAVKSNLRGYGLSHVLLDELIGMHHPGPVECTHTTRTWRRIPRGKAVPYNPYALLWSLL